MFDGEVLEPAPNDVTFRACSVLRESRPRTVPARNAYIICIGQPSPGIVPGRNDPKRTNAQGTRQQPRSLRSFLIVSITSMQSNWTINRLVVVRLRLLRTSQIDVETKRQQKNGVEKN